ncbi:MAG: ribosomal RNA small subunit methyltransferase A [Sedimentisphaerales bacterium]|nr:ribosomal RNA small subunit methyltransferase A [Sedimentisphaerales bacterium]
MQTKQQIRQLLSSAGIQPNGHLGQHFLIDLNLMRLLVDSADIQKDDIVLEVGCGTGSLTEALAEKAGRVIAVELDRNLFDITEKQLIKTENIDLINTDILENKHTIRPTVTEALSAARENFSGRILLVANLPYHVASPVMMNLVTGQIIADGMVVTIQKEVAERMTAPPACDHYGTLSIFLGATGDVETIRILKPAVFWPRPQVDSAMVRFVHSREKAEQIANMALFSEIVHLFMGHRRKTLSASSKLAREKLGHITDWPQIFDKCRIDPTKRPEQLTPADYVAITKYATNCRF